MVGKIAIAALFCSSAFATAALAQMGVSAWYNGLSNNFTDLVSPVADLRDMWGTEVYYNFEVTPWAHLSADLQLVQHARKGDDIAVIPGGRLVIDF